LPDAREIRRAVPQFGIVSAKVRAAGRGCIVSVARCRRTQLEIFGPDELLSDERGTHHSAARYQAAGCLARKLRPGNRE
jgi:hypothetical protein